MRPMAIFSWARVLAVGVAVVSLAACGGSGSKGGGPGAAGSGAGTAGASGGSGGGAAGETSGIAGATAGSAGTSAAGSAGASVAGQAGTAGSTPDASTDASGGAGGAAGGASGSAGSGAKSCGGNAISLASNGTGSASDAAQAHVLIDLMNDLPLGNANRTVEFWAYIKPTDWVGEKNELFVYGTPGTTATAIGLDFGTNEVAGMAGNHATLNPITNGGFNVDSTAYLGVTSAASQWVHIAMTWDGTTLRTYVNGVARIMTTGTGGITTLATGRSPLSLGCSPFNNNCFNGLFDELRVWNVARSPAEIMASHDKALVGNEAGLVGYWKFDEAPGAAMAADSVTTAGHTAHPGALMATGAKPTFVTPTPPAPVTCP
jgi:Concanavalin A-like lectin/glucanases superfamily